jgi:hypothetical protein
MATQPTFTCATCDATIAHHPTFHLGLAFCCAGCAADGPCMCSYDVQDPVPEKTQVPVTLPAPASVTVARPVTRVRVPERAARRAPRAVPAIAVARR